MSFVKRPLTEEEIDINNAVDAHRDALKDQTNALIVAGAFWFVGLLLAGFTPKDSRIEHIGNSLLLFSLVLFAVNFALGIRTRKYRQAARDVIKPYVRRKALPFYQELVEMFADKPDVHLHLADDGKIVVTDKRNQDKEIE